MEGLLGRALKSLPASHVDYESAIEGRAGLNNDIRYEGLPTSGIPESDFDITIHTVFNTVNIRRIDQVTTTDGTSPTDAVLAIAHKSLEGEVSTKRRKQTGQRTFYPIVVSAGGIIEGSTAIFFNTLRSALGNTAFDYFLRDLSLSLMKIRVTALLGG